ncbi:MAG TPA: DUF2934 domain-containing protein [Candidatus Acidoferrales bacterium]|jgi:hypothetical protein|nr:DUF2934 domain-containing protein [Candidatus Acidoferrales bacterium]
MTDIRDLEKGKQQHLPTHEEIEQRAHDIYLRRGGRDGQDMDDWLAAEAELHKERRTAAESVPEKSKTATAASATGFSTRTSLPK